MKKIFTLLMSLVLVVSLSAQSGDYKRERRYGYARNHDREQRRENRGEQSAYRQEKRYDNRYRKQYAHDYRKERRVERRVKPVAISDVYMVGADDYQPTAIIIGGSARMGREIERNVKRAFLETHVTGFQQSSLPNFVISDNNAKFMLGIGGYVNFRTAYDLMGMVDNIDFITYDIPVPSGNLTRQSLYMGASTSRLTLKTIANTNSVGRITSVIETDFRGTPTGSLRLRLAYISFMGFTFGQNVTTFCDLDASPTTVDFKGPNAYNFNFNTMIRYVHEFGDNWSAAIALEMPQLSSSIVDGGTNAVFESISQRMPDIPLYIQYNWGRATDSHIRASFVLRDLMYYNTDSGKTKGHVGWGVQLSGNIQPSQRLNFFMQGVLGRGITPYIQDVTGSGLDLVENPLNPNALQTLPMLGGFAAVQYNIKPAWFVSGGYSQVDVNSRNGYKPDSQYHRAQYIFANTFYRITPNLKMAFEYLHGIRKNMNGDKSHANRIQAMVQYNF